jgi:hypothetical protein
MRVITQTTVSPSISGISTKVGLKGYIHNFIFVGVPLPGQQVYHPHLGPGTVTHVTDHHVHVRFARTGEDRVIPVTHDPDHVRRLSNMSDEEIHRELMGKGEGHHFDLAVNELDLRDRADNAAKAATLYAERPKTDEDRDRVYHGLVDTGENPEDAWGHAYGAFSAEQARHGAAIAQLRQQGYAGRSFQELARSAWKDDVQRRALDAENATNGYLTNSAGKRKNVNGWDLFTGPESTARKYASDELKQHWDQHGRPTFEDFRGGLLGQGTHKRVTEDFLQ